MTQGPVVAGVVLAAGTGRRMGRPKGLLVVDGMPLVARACATLAEGGCDPVVVVLGAAAEEVGALVGDPIITLVNHDWPSGMASSVRSALRWAAGAHPAVDAVVVLPVDTPGIGPVVVERVIGTWVGGDLTRAAVATYHGQARNPVLLPADVWTELASRVQADTGAREWLWANPDRVMEVDCTGLGDPADVDTPQDLARWSGGPDRPSAAGPTGEPHET